MNVNVNVNVNVKGNVKVLIGTPEGQISSKKTLS